MSKPIDDGGPAFPAYNCDSGAVPVLWGTGMSLRDWFASKAMASLSNSSSLNDQQVAEYSYNLSDAMLAERNK